MGLTKLDPALFEPSGVFGAPDVYVPEERPEPVRWRRWFCSCGSSKVLIEHHAEPGNSYRLRKKCPDCKTYVELICEVRRQ